MDFINFNSYGDLIGTSIVQRSERCVNDILTGNPADTCQLRKVPVDDDTSLIDANDYSKSRLISESLNSEMVGEDGDENLKVITKQVSPMSTGREVDLKGENASLFIHLPKASVERVGLVVDLNVCDMDEGKLMSDDSFSNQQGPDLSYGLKELRDPLCIKSTVNSIKEEVRNGNFGEISKDATTKLMEDEHKNELRSAAPVPEERGRENQKEGEYFVSDLVWGKVRSHPWWPGQLLEPSSASDKALKYFKKDSYLIGYLGDQTFAWNDASNLKPFDKYFLEMEKQSRAEAFRTAVDTALYEVSRRVECGLVCRCLPEYVLDRVKCQVVSRETIQVKCTSFVPAELVDYLKSLAKSPKTVVNRLHFTTAKAQLLAFKRWKGFHQLPAFEEFIGILENENDVYHMGLDEEKKIDRQVMLVSNKCDALAKNEKFSTKGTFGKRKNIAAEGQRKKTQRMLDDLMPTISSRNGEKTFQEEINGNIASESFDQAAFLPEKRSYVRKQQVAEKLEKNSSFMSIDKALMVSGPILRKGKPRRRRSTPKDYPPVDEMLSKVILVAETPMETCTLLESIAGFFFNFRNSICLENNSKLRNEDEESPCKDNIADVSELEGTVDTYWIDRMIQNNLEDQVLLEYDEPECLEPVNLKKDGMIQNATLIAEQQGLDLENVNNDDSHTNAMVPNVDENSDEYSPTFLILNFNKLESIPSITNLNNIFTQYGPLHELDTEILTKSKRAKILFKRRPDADDAFSSAGKYSIFGPSLISYRLKYLPKTYKASTASKTKRRKKATPAIPR